MDSTLFTLILCLSLFILCLTVAAYSTWAERKVASIMQDRIGPNRAGPWGLLQPLADGGKFFFKEDFTPKNAEKFLFTLAPGLMMFISLITCSIIPWGKSLSFDGVSFPIQVASVDVGVLFLVGMVSIGVYGIMIGGWASNNKYSLMGAIRASSQMISYELAMGLSLLAIVMMSNSLDLKVITDAQSGWHGMQWNVLYQPVAFLIFFITALAECNRAPFDLPECETELVGGFHTEYSSMKLGLFLFAEYVNMFISSALIVTLFFGGYNFPGMDMISDENTIGILSIVAFLLKTFTFIFIFMWVRWTLPRFRYDQLMHLGWKILIPIALINLLVTGALLLI
jgi:NADH-quinone oxidoreductase subunit H